MRGGGVARGKVGGAGGGHWQPEPGEYDPEDYAFG